MAAHSEQPPSATTAAPTPVVLNAAAPIVAPGN